MSNQVFNEAAEAACPQTVSGLITFYYISFQGKDSGCFIPAHLHVISILSFSSAALTTFPTLKKKMPATNHTSICFIIISVIFEGIDAI